VDGVTAGVRVFRFEHGELAPATAMGNDTEPSTLFGHHIVAGADAR